jgi:hypothetical protein
MSRDDLDRLGLELIAADDSGDADLLAKIAWRLYGEVGTAQAEIERLHGALRAVRDGAAAHRPGAASR